MFRSLNRKTIYILLIISWIACRPTTERKNSNHLQFLQKNIPAICQKMHQCFTPFYRTIPVEYQQLKNLSCEQKMRHNLAKKVGKQEPAIQLLGQKCFQTILKTPCSRVILQSLANPACLAYRKHNFANLKDLY